MSRVILCAALAMCLLSTATISTAGGSTPWRNVTVKPMVRPSLVRVVPYSGSGYPAGLSPGDLRAAHGIPDASLGAGSTVAVVVAYRYDRAESDLSVFCSTQGVRQCTGANGCLRVVNQAGQEGSRPAGTSTAWGLEAALDLQTVHGVAPDADLVLVEADSDLLPDMFDAVAAAASLADHVVMSWGTEEFDGEQDADAFLYGLDASLVAASGDDGVPGVYPAFSPLVVSAGGTTLYMEPDADVRETSWSLSGGGCSMHMGASAHQLGFNGYQSVGCSGMRASPDVSSVADPATGVSVYSQDGYAGKSGWLVVGGTSASAPAVAGIGACAGVRMDQQRVYQALGPSSFRDITAGPRATSGYDLVTGRGSVLLGAVKQAEGTPVGSSSGSGGGGSQVSVKTTPSGSGGGGSTRTQTVTSASSPSPLATSARARCALSTALAASVCLLASL